MQKFRDVLSRWERRELSALEAGELLGCSERQFRRYRARYEEEGLAGLADRRLGKALAKRVPVDELERMLGLYRGAYRGWNVKHFHERLVQHHGFRWGYTWTKTQLHAASLAERARRRRKKGVCGPQKGIQQVASISVPPRRVAGPADTADLSGTGRPIQRSARAGSPLRSRIRLTKRPKR